MRLIRGSSEDIWHLSAGVTRIAEDGEVVARPACDLVLAEASASLLGAEGEDEDERNNDDTFKESERPGIAEVVA